MDDPAFVHAVLSGALAPTSFHHRDHLHLAWVLIRQDGLVAAHARIATFLQHFAAAHGHSERYHETLTQFWVGLVGHLIMERPELEQFEDLLAAVPHILDTGLPGRHWQQETLWSSVARQQWVEPDRLALPW